MKRTFNYTNRKKIPRGNVQIALKKQEPAPPTFDARFSLAGLKLPAELLQIHAKLRRFPLANEDHRNIPTVALL